MDEIERGRTHIALLKAEIKEGMGQVEYISDSTVRDIVAYTSALEAEHEAVGRVERPPDDGCKAYMVRADSMRAIFHAHQQGEGE